MIDDEQWKVIPEFPNYAVSDMGRVKRIASGSGASPIGTILKMDRNTKGYLRVRVSINGKGRHILVHRFVAQAFVPNPLNLPQVNHADGQKTNNRASNLEWDTNQGNKHHAVLNGLIARGSKTGTSRLTSPLVKQIRELYATGAYSQAELAEMFNVQQMTICRAVSAGSRQTWKHVDGPLSKRLSRQEAALLAWSRKRAKRKAEAEAGCKVSDPAFDIYYTLKFYSLPLLLSAVAIAILASRLFRSFRVLLWSAVVLGIACGLWIACFRVLHW